MSDKFIISDELNTLSIKEEISKCESIENLQQMVFPQIRSQRDAWIIKMNEIISCGGYSKTRFAELCGVSRVTVDKWCKGSIPKNRETFLRIGMVAGYSIEKMNQLLQRYGRYPALYSKSLEDCICMYVINNKAGEDVIDSYSTILKRIRKEIVGDEDLISGENISTTIFEEKLSKIREESALEIFISENSAIFANAYHRLYAYIKMTINANYVEQLFADSVYEMAEIQGWSSSLRQCVSAIRQNRWYPTRNKIISLGLHLSMDHDQIDEMLEMAHMEPLCAKNIFESVIMFILDDASLNDMLNIESDDYDPDELCVYAGKILKLLDLPEAEEFLAEISGVEDEWEKQ